MTVPPDGAAAGDGPPGRDEVQALVVAQLAAVLLLPPERIRTASHLTGDLHADSLDLVEVVERVERALAERGWAVRVPEAALASWHTVGDVAEGTHAVLREAAQAP